MASSLAVPDSWEEFASRLQGHRVMVIGGPGSGKSTFCRFLIEQLARKHGHAALLSADPGQPSVGVPTCLGLALESPFDRAAALWFIGDTTPVRNLLPVVVGIARLAALAAEPSPTIGRAGQSVAVRLVIDTSGLIEGPVGRLLKYHKALAAGVDEIIALERSGELETTVALLQTALAAIHRLPAVHPARDRTTAERKAYRQSRYHAYFRDGDLLRLDRRLLVGGNWALNAAGESEEPLPGSLLGLNDRRGMCLGLGIVEQASPDWVVVYSPWRDPQAVAHMRGCSISLDRRAECAESRLPADGVMGT